MSQIKKTGFKTNSDFYQNGGRHIGFKGLSTIFELIDNSIDAEANQVDIQFRTNSGTKLKTIIVEDNGNGFEHGSLLDSVRTWGSTRKYDNTQIGNFGVGMSATMNEVVQDGGEVTIETSDGNGKKETLKLSKKMISIGNYDIEFNLVESIHLGKSFTKITLEGVETNLSTDLIIKNAKVIYYPNHIRRDFKLSVKNGKGSKKQIVFMDPLYRDLDDNEFIKSWNKKFKFDGEEIEITVKALLPGFETKYKDRIAKEKFDVTSGNWLSLEKSGLYLRYGGRYISTGDKIHPGRSTSMFGLNGLRYEIELPKHIKDFPINVNKSKVVLDDSDSKLEDFRRVIDELRKEYKKYYDKTKGKSSKSQDYIDFINDFISDKIKGPRLKTLIKAFPNLKGSITREKHNRDNNNKGVEPKDSGIKRYGKTSGVEIAFEKNVKDAPMFSWENLNGNVVKITYNENSELFKMWATAGKQAVAFLALTNYFEIYSNLRVADEYGDENLSEQTKLDFEKLVREMTEQADKVLNEN